MEPRLITAPARIASICLGSWASRGCARRHVPRVLARGWDGARRCGTLDHMAAHKGRSTVATLFQGAGFLLALLLVAHIVFVLFDFPTETKVASSVAQAAEPLALFFPGLIHAPVDSLQVIADYGLAAMFWMLLGGLLAKVFG